MVLNKESLSDEEAWEIISGTSGSIDEAAIRPLISHDAPSQQLLPPDNTGYVSARQEHHDDLQLNEDCDNNTHEQQQQRDILIEDEDTMISGVSSITGDHQTVVSDVHEEDEVIEEEHIEENGSNINTESIKEKDDLQLIDQLTHMGFKEEEIKIAISNLREAGQTEIDADSIIGQIMGEDNNVNHNSNNNQDPTNPLELPLRSTWEFVESTAQNLDRQHQLRQRTHNVAQSINRSAKELWSNVKDESQKIQSNFRNTCNQADAQARNATAHLQSAASSAKESIVRANEEYSIAEKVAAAAVVGGATLLALGNPRAGVGAMAVAGASLAAGEVVKDSDRDYGLRRGVHLD